jgi:hypothetical protein
MLLTSDYVAEMVERLSALMEAMFQKEQHQYQSKDKIF